MDVRFLKEERQIINSGGSLDQGELPPRQKAQKSLFFPEPRTSFDSLWLFSGGDLTCWDTWAVRRQQYSYHRLYYIRGGEARYITGDRKRDLVPGCLYLFPTYPRAYRIEHNPESPLNVLWCHFELHPSLTDDLLEYNPAEDEEVLAALNLWTQVAKLDQPGNEMYHIISLLMHLLERRTGFHFTEYPLGEIDSYIHDHIRDRMSVDSLASRFGYSRSYFSRVFHEAYKMPPGQYIRSIRMSRAADFLRSGVPVDEVCARLGYTDKKVFFRAFKAHHGLTTSDYLKSHKMQP